MRNLSGNVEDYKSKEDKRKEAEEIWKRKRRWKRHIFVIVISFSLSHLCVWCRQTLAFISFQWSAEIFSSTAHSFWFFAKFIQLHNGRLRRMNSNGWIKIGMKRKMIAQKFFFRMKLFEIKRTIQTGNRKSGFSTII